jgi:hypothetical protein
VGYYRCIVTTTVEDACMNHLPQISHENLLINNRTYKQPCNKLYRRVTNEVQCET